MNCGSIFSSISQTNEDVPLNNIVLNEIPKPISSLIFEDFLGNEINLKENSLQNKVYLKKYLNDVIKNYAG